MSNSFWIFAVGAGGALSFEVLRAYELFGKVTERRFKAIYSSGLLWTLTLGMVIVSGFIAWAINQGADNVSIWQIVVSGIGARSLVAKPLEIKAAHQATQLGEEGRVSFREIFS